MSIDNGTFILKVKKDSSEEPKHEYFVHQFHAIQNILRHEHFVGDVISPAKGFDDFNEARQYADALEKENWTEYGVCIIDRYDHYTLSDLDRLRRSKSSNEFYNLHQT